MKVYHGTNVKIDNPNIRIGRSDTDFGQGFYVAFNNYMAEKWAVRKDYPVVNEYDIDLTGLKIKQFEIDKEWLDFVISNRNGMFLKQYNKYDVLVGTTADDKMFTTIETYEQGFLSVNDTIAILNNMDVGIQACLRTPEAIKALTYKSAYMLDSKTVYKLREEMKNDRKTAQEKTNEMLRQIRQKENSLDISNLSLEQLESIKQQIEDMNKVNKRNQETIVSHKGKEKPDKYVERNF